MSAHKMDSKDVGSSGGEPTNLGALIQLALVGAIIAICTFIFNYFFQQHNSKRKGGKATNGPVSARSSRKQSEAAKKAAAQKKVPKVSKGATAAKVGVLKFKHADHVGTLKAHSSEISDISLSSNGKYLASVSQEDRCVILWSTKELASDGTRNTIRAKVELDNPLSVDFSPDCKALALGVELSNSVKIVYQSRLYLGLNTRHVASPDWDKAHKRVTQPSLVEGNELPQVLEQDLFTCAISPSGNYVMVSDNLGSIYILSLRGDVYGKIDASNSVRGRLSHCAISPCGRFVTFCGLSPEVFLYEVEFTSNLFKGVKRVMILKGHNSAATHFAFSLDAVSIATVSSDSTWQLHSIDVRYKDNEEPRLLNRGEHSFAQNQTPSQLKCMLSCNGKLLGIYDETSIHIKNTVSGETTASYSDFGTGLNLTKCLFDNSAKHAIVSVGKQIVVLSVYKYQLEATIEGLEFQLKQPMTQSTKNRVQNQLKAEKEKLGNLIKDETTVSEKR